MKTLNLSYRFSRISVVIFFAWILSITAEAQSGGGIFQVGPEMMRPKIVPSASLLNNGKVISFGGREFNFVSCAYADMYDPATNVFSEMAMNFPHDAATTVKLSDGRFFILGGGKDLGIPAYSSTEVYDQVSNTFDTKASMAIARMQLAAVQLVGGKVLVVGGWYNTNAATYGEIYDITSNTFNLTGALNVPRANPLVLPTADGGAIVTSGWPSYGGSYFTNVEYYSVANNNFTVQSTEIIPTDPGWVIPPIDKRSIADCKMNDGKYLLMAYRSSPVVEYALLVFDPGTKLFSKLGTSIPLKGEFTDGGFFDVVLNKADNFAYILGVDSGFDPQRIALVSVNLANGKCYQPTSTYNLPVNEYMYAAMTYIPSVGKFLVQGINGSNTSYFNGTKKTYLIKPVFGVGISSTIRTEGIMVKCFPNPSNGRLNISIESEVPRSFEVRMTDVMGRQLLSEIIKVAGSGVENFIYNTSNLLPGFYQLTISDNLMIKTQSIVIAK